MAELLSSRAVSRPAAISNSGGTYLRFAFLSSLLVKVIDAKVSRGKGGTIGRAQLTMLWRN